MRTRWGGLVAAVVVALATRGSAATFTVTSTLDAADAAPGDGVCATGAGACTLRAAIQEANAFGGADTVVLPAGIFRLTLDGAGDDMAATGDLDVRQALEIDGVGADATIVDGLGLDRVFDVPNASALTLVGLAIRHGNATGSTGGGVWAGGPLVLRNVRVEVNRAETGGGVRAAMDTTIEDSVFTGNTALSGDGGGIQQLFGALAIARSRFEGCAADGQGGAVSYGNNAAAVTVADTAFASNRATGSGGGLAVSSATALTVDGSTFTGNEAGIAGGGLFFSSAGGAATVRTTTFDGNAAFTNAGGGAFFQSGTGIAVEDVTARDNVSGVAGGGLFATGAPSIVVTRARLERNATAASAGGGLFVSGNGIVLTDSALADNEAVGNAGGGAYLATLATPITVQGSTFSGNRATGVAGFGGGLFLSPAVASTVANATFSGNAAEKQGGGVFIAGDATVTNVTIVGNAGASGGGLFTTGAVTLANAILASSTGGNCGGVGLASGGHNIDDAGACGFAGAGDRTGDPGLGPLADNGGPAPTHALLPASPAIDAGDPALCPASDERGVARTDGDSDGTVVCDVGAYEFVDLCPADPTKVEPGDCGCGVADTDANGNGVADCLLERELRARLARARALLGLLTGVKGPDQKAVRAELRALAKSIADFTRRNRTRLRKASPTAKIVRSGRRVRTACRRAAAARAAGLAHARAKALAAVDDLDGQVAAD
ncbi:MAG TPA: right-handed parallel beta-helix repeat-containing protein [Candidatus Binatia bacterium]|nr:right-handed parallel beta-helix repeat-containing protein [Candidatus Binatia bacterium]